jgi:putative ABC transport system permease protein
VFGIFTGLAISVACLGIFGMSLFLIQNRVKEIGIRKVLGASVKSLIALTLKDLLLTSVISTIITFPVAYYLINKWLQNFAYRISFDVWIFLLTTLFVMVIVIMTIGIQATRAALMNPVKSIRYE